MGNSMDDSPFIDTIIANPDDDGPRLVYADWLEERGDPRGEFIRLQIQLNGRKMLDESPSRHCGKENALRQRERQLLYGNEKKWLNGLPGDWPVAHLDGVVNVTFYGAASYRFRRGFVEDITWPWFQWAAWADEIRKTTPVRFVQLTTMPEIGIRDGCINWNDGDGQHRGPKVDYDNDDCTRVGLCRSIWPGIDFRLPPFHLPS